MSQNTLIEKIKQDADATVAEIKAASLAEVEDVQRETEAAVKALNDSHTAALDKQKSHLKLVAVARAKQEGNIAVQRAKRDQIDALFTEVGSELEEQAPDQYVAFFQKHAKEIIPASIQVDQVQAPTARLDETKKILQNLGLTGEVVEDPGIKAGFIVRASDGVYDVTLNRLISEKRAGLEMMVVKEVTA